MKFSDFERKYPNYEHQRFTTDSDGNVRFIFNGDEIDPFNADGSLKKKINV